MTHTKRQGSIEGGHVVFHRNKQRVLINMCSPYCSLPLSIFMESASGTSLLCFERRRVVHAERKCYTAFILLLNLFTLDVYANMSLCCL